MMTEGQGPQLSRTLCHFLKKKHLYGKFSHYYRKYVKANSQITRWISIADIPFEKTDEGGSFWLGVSIDFTNYLISEYEKQNIIL